MSNCSEQERCLVKSTGRATMVSCCCCCRVFGGWVAGRNRRGLRQSVYRRVDHDGRRVLPWAKRRENSCSPADPSVETIECSSCNLLGSFSGSVARSSTRKQRPGSTACDDLGVESWWCRRDGGGLTVGAEGRRRRNGYKYDLPRQPDSRAGGMR